MLASDAFSCSEGSITEASISKVVYPGKGTCRRYRELTHEQDAHDHPRHSQMPGRLFILSIGFDPGEMRHPGVTALGYVRGVHAARLTTSIVTFYI